MLASSKRATTTGWTNDNGLGEIFFHGTTSSKCFPLANVVSGSTIATPGGGDGYVDIGWAGFNGGTTELGVGMTTSLGAAGSEPINVALICP